MGAYLSQPVTEKYSTDETFPHLSYGASSMQGWRTTQEDAHDCIPSFDVNTSLFAVYDGHGGSEIAQYCAMHLPDYIKSIPAYKRGNMAQALEDAFLGFDETLTRPEVISELEQISGIREQSLKHGASESSEEDENEVDHLYAEANMPLGDVLAKYQVGLNVPVNCLTEEKPQSPFLRAKQSLEAEEQLSKKLAAISEITNDLVKKSAKLKTNDNISKQDLVNGEKSDSELQPTELGTKNGRGDFLENQDTCKTKDSVDLQIGHVKNDVGVKNDESLERTKETNADKLESVQSSIASSSTSLSESGTTSGQDVQPGCSHGKTSSLFLSPNTTLGKRASKAREIVVTDSDDSSNSEDVTYEEGVPCADSESDEESDDECERLEKHDDEEEEEEEESSEDAEISSEDSDNEVGMGEMMKASYDEEPGADSGCTAVVALLNGNELYVANAGDSRCIVCRNGKAIDMSVDHKPEDELELKRITNAGGEVTSDGRVNGGLNLSRAIGDHTYKKNKALPAKDQMISALPDIRTLTIDPDEDEFMVLACDGIWNYLSSQEVADFVRERLNKRVKLSEICEELFDHCLAPHTRGDGTGCDNMTAIVVLFHKELGQMTSAKRSAVEANGEEKNTKKARSSDECVSNEDK